MYLEIGLNAQWKTSSENDPNRMHALIHFKHIQILISSVHHTVWQFSGWCRKKCKHTSKFIHSFIYSFNSGTQFSTLILLNKLFLAFACTEHARKMMLEKYLVKIKSYIKMKILCVIRIHLLSDFRQKNTELYRNCRILVRKKFFNIDKFGWCCVNSVH